MIREPKKYRLRLNPANGGPIGGTTPFWKNQVWTPFWLNPSCVDPIRVSGGGSACCHGPGGGIVTGAERKTSNTASERPANKKQQTKTARKTKQTMPLRGKKKTDGRTARKTNKNRL